MAGATFFTFLSLYRETFAFLRGETMLTIIVRSPESCRLLSLMVEDAEYFYLGHWSGDLAL